MKVLKLLTPYFLCGASSLICSASTVVIVLVSLLKDVILPETEPGLFDLPSPEFILFIFICPVIHVAGLLFGVVSFWLQPNVNGIGLWAMIISLVLLLLDAFIWFKWTN